MSLFSGIKDLLGKINQLDGAVYSQGRDFAEVYAKNIALEEEIAARTKELEQANQTILTLNSVWDMMNSSQPLSSMLDNIVNILHNDMKYNFAAILKKETDMNGISYFSVKSSSQNSRIDNIYRAINEDPSLYRLPYIDNSIVAMSIRDRKIYSTPDINGMIKMFFPAVTDEFITEVTDGIESKSCTLVPLHSGKEEFGCVIVLADRDGITDTETNFLSLYANQIELAITVAGLFEEVKKQAVTDPLTGIYNRRYFEDNLEKEAERSLRLKQPFSIVALDLDYLKKINDTYGHQYGDVAIKTIATVLKSEARSIDIPARIGGEEFDLLLPGVDSRGALIAAERIRKTIENQVLDTIGGVTASIGVATFLEHSDRIDELIELADRAMYKAKMDGRNRVVSAGDGNDSAWQKVAIDAFIDILAKKLIPVDPIVAADIYQKLENTKNENKTSNDILYSVVDIISQTYNHMYKTGTTKSKLVLAVMIAKKLELSAEETDKLRLAILLYDIGNIMIPEEIFNKKTPLTDEEKDIIKQHPVIAAREILKPISCIQDIIPIIESHHENWNGGGYPGKKSGIEIPVTSQIVLLVDSFYAMTQDRPYRQAYSIDEIINIIKSEVGKRWNGELVEQFVKVVKDELFRS